MFLSKQAGGQEDSMGRPITVGNLVTNMLETAQKWDATSTIAAEIMPEFRRIKRIGLRTEED